MDQTGNSSKIFKKWTLPKEHFLKKYSRKNEIVFNENEITMYQICGMQVTVLRGKFIGLNTYIKKEERSEINNLSTEEKWALRQDGEVEGLDLTSSQENTKITTNCWTTMKKRLEPTKKDILHPNTKKKPQQDNRRGTFMI